MSATEWWLLVSAALAGVSALAVAAQSLSIYERVARMALPAAIVALAVALMVSPL